MPDELKKNSLAKGLPRELQGVVFYSERFDMLETAERLKRLGRSFLFLGRLPQGCLRKLPRGGESTESSLLHVEGENQEGCQEGPCPTDGVWQRQKFVLFLYQLVQV